MFHGAHAEPAMIERPVIRRLIGLVVQDPMPAPVRFQWPWGASVTIVTRSGERFSSIVDAPKGSAPRGIQWVDIEAKYNAPDAKIDTVRTPSGGSPRNDSQFRATNRRDRQVVFTATVK